jgi:hypothetical protein
VVSVYSRLEIYLGMSTAYKNNKEKKNNKPTKLHWARMVGYGPFSLCVIHKEGLCPSSGDINRLVMIMMKEKRYKRFKW